VLETLASSSAISCIAHRAAPMSASPARASTAWCHAGLSLRHASRDNATGDHPLLSVIRQPSALALCMWPARMAMALGRYRGQREWFGGVGPCVPGLLRGSGASDSAAPGESTRSTRPFALRRYGLHALIARLERASDGSAPPWRTSLPPPGPHRQGRHHGVGDEFEARAPDGADAREPSGQFARSEQPTGSTVALACADGVRRA
jgi:hypothetical protein